MSDLWSRVKKGRLAQILVVYTGVSWVVLQVVGELREALELPAWVGPVVLIFLAVGLVIVLATAWVQSHPLLEQRARTDEVPGAWEVDLGEMRRSVAGGRLPHLTWSRAILGGVVAFSLLLGLAGLVVVLRDRGAFAPDEAIAEEAAPGVAVLPFSVSGPDVEFWREGMVDVLSTSLDGLAGLRAIDSRTVLARWREAAPGDGAPDLEKALRAARSTGARFAVLGNVVSTGSRAQLAADVYELGSGRKLGSARVDGSADPDSAFALVDRLTLETLGVVPRPQGGELPPVDLAALTTRSVEALRAYLEGEHHFRRTEWRPAAAAYERAVELDSTFALAHYRLSLAYGWADYQAARGGHHLAAVRFADRLPERERLLVRGHLEYQRGRPEACVQTLEEVTLRYPDDLEAWYLLGECQLHFGDQMLRNGVEWSGDAFRRAAELDPGFLPAVQHLADVAWDALDTARIAELDRAYEDAGDWQVESRLAYAIAFGDSAAREDAFAALDTLSPEVAGGLLFRLSEPPLLADQERVLDRLDGPATYVAVPDPADAWFRSLNALARGRVSEFVATLEDERIGRGRRQVFAYAAHAQGVPLPEEVLARLLSVSSPEESGTDPAGTFAALAYAAESGGVPERRERLESLSQLGDSLWTAGDTMGAGRVRGFILAQEGFGAWQRGDREEALRFLERAQSGPVRGWGVMGALNGLLRVSLADLLLEMDRPEAAEPYLRSQRAWAYPLAWLHLAEIHDARGELGEAARWYARFTEIWVDADEELQPMVERARGRLEQILAERG